MISTTIVYIENNGKYLMMNRNRKRNDENKGKWIGIGGHFEEGESPEECARREVKEETGLTLGALMYRGIVTFASDLWETQHMHLFLGGECAGEAGECDEGELKWIDKREIYDLPMWKGDKIFLKLMDAGAGFFSLKLEYAGDELERAVLNERELLLDEPIEGQLCKH